MTRDQTLGLALFAGYVVGSIVTAVAMRGMLEPCKCRELAAELELERNPPAADPIEEERDA